MTQAITQHINEEHQKELEQLKKTSEAEREKLIAYSKKRIEEEKIKAAKEVEEELKKKISEEMEMKLKDRQNESEELKKQKKELQEQLLELNKMMRRVQDENKEKELEMMKKFNEEQDKVRHIEQKRMEEQFRLQILEKEKKLQDAIKANEDLRRKLEQGSQQMQGEILELAIEELLQKEFPYDEIKPVPKGINGADIIHCVRSPGGKACGSIIWEMKRTKAWSQGWVSKLKDDQRNIKAELAVIISDNIPDGLNHFGLLDGVWICKFEYFLGLAYALRSQLIEVSVIKSAQIGQQSKMEVLYNYITSIEFRHRVEAIIEAFGNMQEEIEKERRWFSQKWAREEKNLRKVLDTTVGMHGDLQSIMGKSIGELKQVAELSDGKTDESLF